MHLLTTEDNDVPPLNERYMATEKAEVLCITAEGLLSRLYSLSLKLKNGEIDPLVNSDWKAMRNMIDKNFMDEKLPVNLTTLPNYEKFKDSADTIQKEIREAFVLIIETIELTKGSQKVLETILNRSSGLSLEKTAHLHNITMELIILLGRIHLFWDVEPTVREKRCQIVVLFQWSHHVKNDHRNDALYSSAIEFLRQYQNGLGWINVQYLHMAPFVGDMILEIYTQVVVASDHDELIQNFTYAILNQDRDAIVLPPPYKNDKHVAHVGPDVFFLNGLKRASLQYIPFIIFASLLFPSELYRSQEDKTLRKFDTTVSVVDCFQLILERNRIIPLYRDVFMDVHGYFYNFLKCFPPEGYIVPIPPANLRGMYSYYDLKTHTNKTLKTLANDFNPAHKKSVQILETTKTEKQAGMLIYLLSQIDDLNQIMSIAPELSNPKFELLISAFCQGKKELLWLLIHEPIFGNQNLERSNGAIFQLMNLLRHILELVNNREFSIRSYHYDYIAGYHYFAIMELLMEIIPVLSSMDTENKQHQETIQNHTLLKKYLEMLEHAMSNVKKLGKCQEDRKNNYEEYNREMDKLRKVALRAITLLASIYDGDFGDMLKNHETNGCPFNDAQYHLISLLQRRLNALSRSIAIAHDWTTEVIRDTFNLKEIWWYRDQIKEVYINAFASSPQKIKFRNQNFLCIIKAFDDVYKNATYHSMEEEKLFDDCAIEVATEYINILIGNLHQISNIIITNRISLAEETLPVQAANRFEKSMSSVVEPLPGFESITVPQMILSTKSFSNESNPVVNAQNLRIYELQMAEILSDIERDPVISIGSRKFYLRNRVRKEFGECMEKCISALFRNQTLIPRPSLVLRYVQQFCDFLTQSKLYLDIDCLGIIRRQLIGLGWLEEDNMEKLKLSPLYQYATFYQFELLKKTRQRGVNGGEILYSDARHCFISSIVEGSEYEVYTEKAEMDALVQLVGPKGVTFIENSLMKRVEAKFLKVCKVLVDERETISAFKQNHRNIKSISAPIIDTFLNSMRDIGYCFALLRLLSESLHGIQEENCSTLSSLYSCLREVVDFDKLLLDPEMARNKNIRENLILLTSKRPLRSPKIISMLQRFIDKNQVSESALLSLPYALALAFDSDFWVHAHYIPDHDTYTENVHLVVLAFSLLLPCFDILNNSGENISSANLAENFVASSALVILTPVANGNKSKRPENTFVLLSLLEKFVGWSDEAIIDRASLEKYIPYALLHHGQMEIKKDSFLHGERSMQESPFGSE